MKFVLFFVIASALGLSSGVKLGYRSDERLAQKYPIFSSRITGGENAKEGEFPYQICLEYKKQFTCGGVIIGENVILTAAHCVANRNSTLFEIAAGFTNIKEPGPNLQRRVVKKIISHPAYPNAIGPNDIAVLILATPLKMTPFVQKVLLPAAGQEFTGNAVISGWGSTSRTTTPIYPVMMQKAKVPIITYEECAKMFASDVDKKSNICTGPIGDIISGCSGDSGGPLVAEVQGKKYVIGLVSWGTLPCGMGYPSVYTKVSNFIDFINKSSK